jgi:7-keto-8-aminopelargonate synthetase-like enzyme
MGTLSKAYGCIGGFIATEHYVASILRMGCPAYGFTSTLPPDQAAAVLEALDIIADEPERRERLWDNQRALVGLLHDAGINPEATTTPILPIRIGDEATCLRVAAALASEGIHVDAVTFPAIPVGDSRLRIIVNSDHTIDQMRALVEALVLALSLASVP